MFQRHLSRNSSIKRINREVGIRTLITYILQRCSSDGIVFLITQLRWFYGFMIDISLQQNVV